MLSNTIGDKVKQCIDDNLLILKMTYNPDELKRKYYRFAQYTPKRSYRVGFLLPEYKVFDLITGDTLGNKIDRVGNNLFKVTTYVNHPFDTYYTVYDYYMKVLFKYRGNNFSFKKLSDNKTLIVEGNSTAVLNVAVYDNTSQQFKERYTKVRFIEELDNKIRILYYSDDEYKVISAEYIK